MLTFGVIVCACTIECWIRSCVQRFPHQKGISVLQGINQACRKVPATGDIAGYFEVFIS